MIRNGIRVLFTCAWAAGLLASSRAALAQSPPQAERPTTTDASTQRVGERVFFHDSLFLWENAVTTQTLGIGRDYQSRNPVYEMTFRLAPRFYFFDDPLHSLSARADLRLVREFTNNDTTTQRGEWTFLDAEVWLAYVRALRATPGSQTDFVLRFPSVLFPTSKTSWMSGRSVGLGAGIGVDQAVPLRGEGAVLSSVLLRPRATYTYQFVSSPVATRSGFDRIRLDPEGRSLPNDQTSGSALPQHLLNLSLRVDTTITDRVRVITEVGMRYARRYALPGSVPIQNVDTGPVMPQQSPQPARWDVITLFSTGVYYAITHSAEVGIGYENLAGQLGPDGRRRSFFYSPDARVFLALVVPLGELYHDVRHEQGPEPNHTASAATQSVF